MANDPGEPATPADRTADSKKAPEKNGGAKVSWLSRPVTIICGVIILCFASYIGLMKVFEAWIYESTDDAFLDGNIVSVAPRVAGQVARVHFVNYQEVRKGDALVELDPRDLAVAAEQKKAAVTSAEANTALIHASIDLLKAQVASAEALAKQSAADVKAAEASAERARADFSRAEELIKGKAISSQEYDAARAAYVSAEANLASNRQKAVSDEAKVVEAQAQLQAGRKAFERAEAQTRQTALDQQAAELNLSYAKIDAPSDGYVARKAVEAGDYVQPGQRLLALVEKHLWVVANFKETQLKKIRPGQKARISIDSVSGKELKGHVTSTQAGSGSRFSLLPPENAVGNYVKVVQRVPVRIEFDDSLNVETRLGPGMSVEPKVKVKDMDVSPLLVAVLACVVAAVAAFFWWRWAARARSRG